MFRCRGGAGSPIEGKQKAFVPPPAGRAGRVPREVFRGKCRIPPAGFASRGRVVSPRRGTRRPPLGASGALPPRFARLRGRELPRFCRLHHVGLLRPGSRNCPFPAPRGCDSLHYHDTIIVRHACGNFRSRPAREIPEKFLLSIPARLTQGFFRLPLTGRTRFSRPRVPRLSDSGCSSPALPTVKLPYPTRAGAAQSFSTMQSPRDTRNKR